MQEIQEKEFNGKDNLARGPIQNRRSRAEERKSMSLEGG
jgi:hypothetical protein